MRIGIDITPVIYQGTGVSTYTRELVRHLLSLAPKSHFRLLASTLRGQKKLSDYLMTLSSFDNFSVAIYPFPPVVTEIAWNKFHFFAVERLVGDIDVFHAWDWQQPPVKKAKLVTTIHDLTPLKFPQEHKARTIKVQQRRLRWVKQQADAIITDSDSSKKDVINLLGIDKRKVHTVYLAASEQFSEFSNQPIAIRNQAIKKVKRKYNIGGDYILSVGTHEPRKNLSRVIEAFTQLTDRSGSSISKTSQLSLVIAGKYGWGKEVQSSKFKVQNGKVKILGFVEQQNLPALYAGAKVFVYPSLYEGFGLPVLEAMGVGCPVVTSGRGSLKEVVGDAGVMVDPENPSDIAAGIKTALGDASVMLARKGLKQVKKFSWRKTARQTLAIYKSVLA